MRLNNTIRAALSTNLLSSIDGAGRILEVYSGALPANLGDAPAGTLLAEVPLDNPVGAVSGQNLVMATPIEDPTGNADGTPTYYRVMNGATALVDGRAGSGQELDITGDIQTGVKFVINSWTISPTNNPTVAL
jgi:hypothetical protein